MNQPRRSVLALAVLSMLTEEPMHAYRMQQLIKERRKADVVNVSQRNSVYQTIQRLVRDGLVAVESTERAENRPERTTYRITDSGRAALGEWLRAMLSTPTPEYPEFPAALSFLPNLAPADALDALTTRADRLAERLTALDAEIIEVGRFLPRLFAIESEYQRQVVAAELAYVRTLIQDLRAERITWPFVDGAPVWPG
ncbi:PadR family transcriptional regulator [Micromonospora sp. DR5-3]|uniref:PadR family transcriptional regulator n=1 Tax=unclassified Micromonospora TaxID=2617518 RepID=UPI00210647A0|nr:MULTISPECIES: PadR family transcriptional regulator [unclassified Micromonospora]MCW3815954.1 PadR family transcriptional regulator [Micromonospora sp. DR5-3]